MKQRRNSFYAANAKLKLWTNSNVRDASKVLGDIVETNFETEEEPLSDRAVLVEEILESERRTGRTLNMKNDGSARPKKKSFKQRQEETLNERFEVGELGYSTDANFNPLEHTTFKTLFGSSGWSLYLGTMTMSLKRTGPKTCNRS